MSGSRKPDDGICPECLERDVHIVLLRQLLFKEHPCPGKYGDDGELQCSRCHIDFRRDSVAEIAAKLTVRDIDRVMRGRVI